MELVLNGYDAKLDSKKRITLRNASYEYYHVEELADGRLMLSPRVLTDPFEMSKNTLDMLDSSMSNFKEKRVSKKIDLSKIKD